MSLVKSQLWLCLARTKTKNTRIPTTSFPGHRRTLTLSRSRKYSLSSYNCGALTSQHVGTEVTVRGWLQSLRVFGNVRFATVRDSTGLTQLVWEESLDKEFGNLKTESVIEAKGTVLPRPPDMQNKRMKTGEIEVQVKKLEVLSSSEHPLPLPVETHFRGNQSRKKNKDSPANQETRLKHRYLDIRSPSIQRNLRVRSAAAIAARVELDSLGFVEVETPTLFKSTPEGAREFLVPSRLEPGGRCYALPQSPQQYKQLLMVGGVDKYFQVARCYRDESGRPDRQPEFTQLDIEMSFSSQEDIQKVVEQVLHTMWSSASSMARKVARTYSVPEKSDEAMQQWERQNIPWQLLQKPPDADFPRLTYREAMDKYGSDKPDTRFDLFIQKVEEPECQPDPGNSLRGLLLPNMCSEYSNKKLKELCQEMCEFLLQKGQTRNIEVVAVKVGKDASWGRSVAAGSVNQMNRVLKANPELKQRVLSTFQARENDILLLAVGKQDDPCEALGYTRSKIGPLHMSEEQKLQLNWVWITDFPLFEVGSEGKIKCAHHPFTMPDERDMNEFRNLTVKSSHDELLRVRGQSYDLVCNGVELGGGSIRVHTEEIQRHVLEACLGHSKQEVETLFPHYLAAFKVGCPPHGKQHFAK